LRGEYISVDAGARVAIYLGNVKVCYQLILCNFIVKLN